MTISIVRHEYPTRYDTMGVLSIIGTEGSWNPASNSVNTRIWMQRGDILRLVGPTNGTVQIHLLKPE